MFSTSYRSRQTKKSLTRRQSQRPRAAVAHLERSAKKMKCPNCNGPLVAGEVFFKKSLGNLLMFGFFGSKDLMMATPEGEEVRLLAASETAAVQFCEECGVAVIATEKGR